MIAIVLEGGLVQSVVTDDPARVGEQVLTIDYDTEGMDPLDLDHVIQSDQSVVRAYVGERDIEASAIRVETVDGLRLRDCPEMPG